MDGQAYELSFDVILKMKYGDFIKCGGGDKVDAKRCEDVHWASLKYRGTPGEFGHLTAGNEMAGCFCENRLSNLIFSICL